MRGLILELPKSFSDKLNERAKREGNKVSDVARRILSEYFEKKKTEPLKDTFISMLLEDAEIKQIIAKKLKEK